MKSQGTAGQSQRILSILCAGCGIVLLWAALRIAPATISELRFATLGTLFLSSRWCFLVCGALLVLIGALGSTRMPAPWLRTVSRWAPICAGVLSILLWASMGRRFEVIGMLAQSVRLGTPIALGAMAGLMSERCGVVNIAIEGMMLSAACGGFIAALYTQNIWVGLLAAVASGGLLAMVHAGLTIHGMVDQIISGTAINLLAIGGTGFLRRTLLLHNLREAPAVSPTWPCPFLSDIPILGQILFRHQPIVYTMFFLAALLHVVLFITPWGLRSRAVGENPRAADALGVQVFTIRYVNVLVSGMLAGLGGAWFSLETVGAFEDLMTGGKGFIALAAMIFGRWTPFGALSGALLFGFADALQIKLQIAGVAIPYQFLGMTPYLITMLVLAGLIGRATPPAAIGMPYRRNAS